MRYLLSWVEVGAIAVVAVQQATAQENPVSGREQSQQTGNWFDDLGDEGQAVLLGVTGIVLLVILGVLMKIFIFMRKYENRTQRRTARRKQEIANRALTLSDALGVGYVVKDSKQNPLRSEEFKPIMDMLIANGEFADEADTEHKYFAITKRPDSNVDTNSQLLQVEVGDIVKNLDREGDWLWCIFRGKEGWVDVSNARELSEKELADYKKGKAAKKAKKAAEKKARMKEETLSAEAKVRASLTNNVPTAADSLAWDPSELSEVQSSSANSRPDPSASVKLALSAVAEKNAQLLNPLATRMPSTASTKSSRAAKAAHLAPVIMKEDLDILDIGESDVQKAARPSLHSSGSPSDNQNGNIDDQQPKTRKEALKAKKPSMKDVINGSRANIGVHSPIDPHVAKQFYDMFQ